uniref:Uncharacterized protein n=1 Tax=Oryza punctata TaxID=4537 RepID=A0A0E0JIU8_ORYPU
MFDRGPSYVDDANEVFQNIPKFWQVQLLSTAKFEMRKLTMGEWTNAQTLQVTHDIDRLWPMVCHCADVVLVAVELCDLIIYF